MTSVSPPWGLLQIADFRATEVPTKCPRFHALGGYSGITPPPTCVCTFVNVHWETPALVHTQPPHTCVVPGGSSQTSSDGELRPHNPFGGQGPKSRFALDFEQFQNEWLWGVTVPHFWTKQSPGCGPSQGRDKPLESRHPLPTGSGVPKSQDQPCSIPALGEAEGPGGMKVKGAAPCFWMPGMNLRARSRSWETPHPWTTGHIRTDPSCHRPCLMLSPQPTGSTLHLEDHSYIARLGRQEEVGLKTSK